MSNSPFNLEAIVSDLKEQVELLDADHKEKRGRLIGAITALTGEPATTLDPDFVLSKELTVARLRAVDTAIRAMPQEFTTIELRDFLRANNPPDVVQSIRGSYLPTRLTLLAAAGKIKLQEQGEGGAPNRWIKR